MRHKSIAVVRDLQAITRMKETQVQRFVTCCLPVIMFGFRDKYLGSLTSVDLLMSLDQVYYSTFDLIKYLINLKDFVYCDHNYQFLLRIKKEFEDYFRENPGYIDIGEYRLDKSEFSPVIITPDNTYFIRGSNDGKLKEFNMLTGGLERVFGSHKMAVYNLAISYDGKFLASSCDSTIKIWDYASGDIMYHLSGHEDVVNCLQFDPKGGYLLSGSSDSEIKVWNLESGKVKKTLNSHWDKVLSLDYSRDGSYLVSSALDTTINLWDITSGRLVTTFIEKEGNIHQVAIAENNSFIVSATNSKLKIWDIKENKLLQIIHVPHEDYDFYSFVLTPDSKFIVTALQGPLEEGGALSMWRVSDGKLIYTIPIREGFKAYSQKLNMITLSQDGVFIVGAARDRIVKVWMDFLTYVELEEVFAKSKEKRN